MSAHRDRVNGEVIGFRRWRIGRDLDLLPLSAASRWRPGVQVARCAPLYVWGHLTRPHDHAAPATDCECGIYAYHERDPYQMLFSVGDALYVEGVIQAWGRMAVHEEGFRAEFARVVALALPEKGETLRFLIPAVARRYGAVAVPESVLGGVAREFGEPVPVEYRPIVIPKPEPEFPPVRITLGLATPEPGIAFQDAKAYIEEIMPEVTVEEVEGED